MNDGKETPKNTFLRMVELLKGSFKRGELYTEEAWLKSVLVDPKSKDVYQPQVLQGMWQAYGQMRSVRTRGRYAVLATGVIGVGLFAYRVVLDQEKKEVEESKRSLADTKNKNEELVKDIAKRQKRLRKDGEVYDKLLHSYKMLDGALKASDLYVAELCRGDEQCLSQHEELKIKAIRLERDRIFVEQGIKNKM